MIDDLGLRAGLDGRVVRHRVGDVRPRAHRHAELEVNLVVRGTASTCSATGAMHSRPAR